jgi:hypothetical protein
MLFTFLLDYLEPVSVSTILTSWNIQHCLPIYRKMSISNTDVDYRYIVEITKWERESEVADRHAN